MVVYMCIFNVKKHCEKNFLQVQSSGAMFWCIVLVQRSGATFWCNVLMQCSGEMFWYNVVVQCSVAMFWCIVLVQCFGAMFWCNVLVQRSSAMFWCNVLVQGSGATFCCNFLVQCSGVMFWCNVLQQQHAQLACWTQQFLKVIKQDLHRDDKQLNNCSSWTADQKNVKATCGRWLGSNPSPQGHSLTTFLVTLSLKRQRHSNDTAQFDSGVSIFFIFSKLY